MSSRSDVVVAVPGQKKWMYPGGDETDDAVILAIVVSDGKGARVYDVTVPLNVDGLKLTVGEILVQEVPR